MTRGFFSNSLSPLNSITPFSHHIAAHGILHLFFNIVRTSRKSRITRARMRKILNRKRRRFVDNIIMHHQRLHNKNREIAVATARTKFLMRKIGKKNKTYDVNRWRDFVSTKDRGKEIRGRIDARRTRARSRWLSVKEEFKFN